MSNDRRSFLQLFGTSALAASFPGTIKKALAVPAHHRTGTIADVEHVVILMQENRSFDHYFGALRGVRGFGDPRAVRLPSGVPVWEQPNGAGRVLPFRPDAPDLGLKFLEGTPHGYPDTLKAWNQGRYDQWVPAKGENTMTFLTRKDIPYHYALADAFTICDAYHCSFLGATDPNRYHMWTGWVGNDGKGGGPVMDNAEAGYDWSTYPERLSRNGISWKIYQDAGAGLDAEHYWGWGDDPYIGNYGDNSLLYFHQYQNAQPGSPLFQGARTATDIQKGGTLFDHWRADIKAKRLPQVSWIVAPEAYTEHPNWPANYGAWYVAQILEALLEDPELFSKTAFFLNYDENDGFFDHVVPPTPPQSRAQGLSTVDTTNEIFPGKGKYGAGPYGLGVRVPMIVISPWSRGGWVNSEVFDHTSLIQFLERRYADGNPDLIEANITPWRRAVTGDLTSAFDFNNPNRHLVTGRFISLPSTDAYAPPDRVKHPDFDCVPPVNQVMPTQEPGIRPARPVPYELHVEANRSQRAFELRFANTGTAAAVFQVRSGASSGAAEGPWTYTVGPDAQLAESWDLTGKDAYALSVYGPNGFFRSYRGSLAGKSPAHIATSVSYDRERISIALELRNEGHALSLVRVRDEYSGTQELRELHPGGRTLIERHLHRSFGWYDFVVQVQSDQTFEERIAGHLETGEDSTSDPAFGRSVHGKWEQG